MKARPRLPEAPIESDLDPLTLVRREFAAGLPDRVEKMRSALEVLEQSRDEGMIETFHRGAHSLKGTAASFGANDLSEPAAFLEDLGRRWREGGALSPEGLADGVAGLERLASSVRLYQSRFDPTS